MLRHLSKLVWTLLFAVVLTTGAGTTFAQTQQTCGTTTWNLTAGQTIDVGSVTVANDNTNLYVTYKLDYTGAYFGTLHLWIGNDLTNVPSNPQGVPVPGQFPYQYTPPNNTTTEYTFTIPFTDLKIQDVANACPLQLYVVAHAEVNNVDGNNETAFGGNVPVNVGTPGRWWYCGVYSVCCDFGPPPVRACKTAFGKGGWVFTTDRKANPESLPSLLLSKNRWGWAINPKYPGSYVYDIWAGAGLNKTVNGTKVGTLTVDWSPSGTVTVTYTLFNGSEMTELHIYAGDAAPITVAPGQYGYIRYFDPPETTHTATFNVTDAGGDGIWIIAHAVVCTVQQPN
jgi:hypothetical protein